VKQYEPYFSTSFEFEDASQLVERGITPFITYDAAGRAIRTDLPGWTFTKVEFDSWMQLPSTRMIRVLKASGIVTGYWRLFRTSLHLKK